MSTGNFIKLTHGWASQEFNAAAECVSQEFIVGEEELDRIENMDGDEIPKADQSDAMKTAYHVYDMEQPTEESLRRSSLAKRLMSDDVETRMRAVREVRMREGNGELGREGGTAPSIIVTVKGGLVQDVQFCPECPLGLEVKVQDYDIKSHAEDELREETEVDSEGDHFSESIWFPGEE